MFAEHEFQQDELYRSVNIDRTTDDSPSPPRFQPGESSRTLETMHTELEDKRLSRARELGLDEDASYEVIHRAADKQLRLKLGLQLGLLDEEYADKMARGKYNVSWREIFTSALGYDHFSGNEQSDIEELVQRTNIVQDMFTRKRQK